MTKARRIAIAVAAPSLAMAMAGAVVSVAPLFLMVVFYALLSISSFLMVVGWGGPAFRFISDENPLRSTRFLVAYGLTINAIVMGAACAWRGYDLAFGGPVMGSDVAVLAAALAGLLYSKTIFVWASSQPVEISKRVGWAWPSLLVLGGFAAGVILVLIGWR